MKRKAAWAIIPAMLILITVLMSTVVMADQSKYVTTTMNFRSGPGGNYSIIGQVPAGSKVVYHDSYNDWDRITYNNVTAYIHGGNLADNYNPAPTPAGTWTVRVPESYLALRSAKAFAFENEIGKLWTGDTVEVKDTSDDKYWYVYSPKLGLSGYVNKNYLYRSAPTPSGETRTVSVDEGYLALRTAKAFAYENEIGKLYTGDTVQLIDTSDPTYWYVYAPSLGLSGYVNKNFLRNGSAPTPSANTKTVSVSDGYLALRYAPGYDASNEIGKLWTGEKVQVQNTDGQYWYVYAPSLGKYGYVNKDYLY